MSILLRMMALVGMMYPDDKSTPGNVNYNRLRSFCSMIKQCGLLDLGFNGPAYTWTNKRYVSMPTYERIDRVLANAEWCALFPNANVYNLPIIWSDHAPILTVLHSKYKKPSYTFKFENWWLLEDDFHDTAMKAWYNSVNQSFHVRTRHLTGSLRVWSRKKKALQDQITRIEKQIQEVQLQPPGMRDHLAES